MPLLALLLAYILGSIPFGFVLVKWTTGRDVRTTGSGNIGATNVLRTTGRAAGIATLLLDIAKGYAAVVVAGYLTAKGSVVVLVAGHLIGGSTLWMSAAALAVMAGHAYPVFLRFHGGKAVASFVGAFLALTPGALALTLVIFLGVTLWTRHVSMGSIVAAATFPLAVWILLQPAWPVWGSALVAAAFIVYRHRSNIERLRSGSEHVFQWRSKR